MSEINWFHLVGALLGGGATGSIITAVVTSYRARQQPVGTQIDILPVFRPSGKSSHIEAAIAVKHNGNSITFENLFIIDMKLVNKGNRDLEELRFGATLAEGDRCIFVEMQAPDRHHTVNLINPVTPDAPRQEVDFALKPFNRQDIYSLKFYLVIPQERQEPEKISLSSASPVRFVAMPNLGETMAKAASEITISAGPLIIGVTRRK